MSHFITYKQSQYLLLPRQLKFEHAKPERYTISLLNNIRNLDHLLAVQVLQNHFLLGYKYFRYENTSDKCLQKVWCGTIRGCGTIKVILKSKDKTLQIVPLCGTIQGCGTITQQTTVQWYCLVVTTGKRHLYDQRNGFCAIK